jgi:hypothetical protein
MRFHSDPHFDERWALRQFSNGTTYDGNTHRVRWILDLGRS